MKFSNRLLKLKTFLLLPILFLACSLVAQTDQNQENSVVISQEDRNLKWGPCPEFMPEGCALAVLNGDPAQRNADVFLKIPASATISNHTHTSAERMILVDGELEVHYEGEDPQRITTGSYAHGPAGKAHTARCGDTPCTLFIAFEEPVDAFEAEAKNKP